MIHYEMDNNNINKNYKATVISVVVRFLYL